MLIGTGGGYGESVVLQLGENNWVVIDSCINPSTKKSLPLEYLEANQVDLSHVKLIICSHWHKDHIEGIDLLLDACKAATLAFTITSDRNKFLQFVGLDNRIDKKVSNTSTTETIARCLKIASARKTKVKDISQDKVLFCINEKGIDATICSLSPSNAVTLDFYKEITELLTDSADSSKRINVNNPNTQSVVIAATVNGYSAILGGDLEISEDSNKGWICILDDCEYVKNLKSAVFKVPHHGSITGYEQRIWDELLEEEPIAQITPYCRGKKFLPEKEMLKTIIGKTKNTYITSYSLPKKAKSREKSLEKAILDFNKTVKEIKFDKGIIESHIDLNAKEKKWITILSDMAFKVNEEFIEKLQ